eukprot:Colp12_sorted_trinity150504_noHs@466
MAEVRVPVGVGVIVVDESTSKILIGRRKGSHGSGTYALPGGWLEFGESFEKCASREVDEETGLVIDGSEVAYVSNNVFEEGKHSVTVFMRAVCTGSTEPINKEPHKCDGWLW